jgi:hypothetical protein
MSENQKLHEEHEVIRCLINNLPSPETAVNKQLLPWRQGQETKTRFIPMSWRDNVFVSQDYINYLHSLTGKLGRMWRDGD